MSDGYNSLEDLVDDLCRNKQVLPSFFARASGGFVMYEQVERCYLDKHSIPNFRLTLFNENGSYISQFLRNKRGVGDALMAIPQGWLVGAFRPLSKKPDLDMPNSIIPPDLKFKRFMERTQKAADFV